MAGKENMMKVQLKGKREPNWLEKSVLKGERSLLENPKVAILNSQSASPDALKLSARVAEFVQMTGYVVITSTTKTYRAVFEVCLQKKIPAIVVADRSVEELRDFWKESQNLLFIFPFSAGVPYQISNQIRDEIITSMADVLIGIEITEGGTMERLIREAHSHKRPLFVARFPSSSLSPLANPKLIQEGIPFFTPDITLRELQHHLKNLKKSRAPFTSKKELGQFFTPSQVADFMYELISTYLGKPIPEEWKILDPACGEGIFLQRASEKSIVPDDHLYGIEIDPELHSVWEQSNIRNRFNLFITDGLMNQSELGIQEDSFDLVIGNPPFGGAGLKDLLRLLPEEERAKGEKDKEWLFETEKEETEEVKAVAEKGLEYAKKSPLTSSEKHYFIHLLLSLERYDGLKKAPVNLSDEHEGGEETGIFGKVKKVPKIRTKDNRIRTDALKKILQELDKGIHKIEGIILQNRSLQDWVRRVASFPIEVLFVERFIRLAKPGGFIAIIVPDGILANYQLQFLRDWMMEKADHIATISLPRETFKESGIIAKTSIIFLRKYLLGEKPNPKGIVFMAKAEYVGVNADGKNDLPEIVNAFAKFWKTGKLPDSHHSPLWAHAWKSEQRKAGRMDFEYWRDEYKQLERFLRKKGAVPLKNLTHPIISGYRAGPLKFTRRREIAVIKVGNILDTGVDWTDNSVRGKKQPGKFCEFLCRIG